jgi:hypothetical protein
VLDTANASPETLARLREALRLWSRHTVQTN